jgi:hypothetical protein
MKYNQVGIDTIRFDVTEQGFRKWLKKHGFRKVKVETTPLTSKTLQRKIEQDKSIRVVKINSSYPNKLSNYLIVGKASKKRYYSIEIAGLHQPTNGKLAKETYEIIAELINKYLIESVDYAIDFLAQDNEIMNDKEAIARALSSEIAGTFDTSTYFVLGADYCDEADPIGGAWKKDSVLYWKAQKEMAKGKSGLNSLWYRLELRIDNDTGFREPHHTKPKAWNKMFLSTLKDYVINSTPISDVVSSMSQTDEDYEFLNEQLKYFFEGRSLRYYMG